MLRITQIKIPVNDTGAELKDRLCRVLKIEKDRLLSWRIARKSIEARRHEPLSYVYTIYAEIKNEAAYLRKNRNKNISAYKEIQYQFPKGGEKDLQHRPIIIGSGPAGLFCAYFLAKNGYSPIILERGEKIEERTKTVKKFWETGVLNTQSNVQFGEGGAGTFSDGKLNTGISDKYGRSRAVLEIFVKNGAPKEILYDAMPHIGTDILRNVIVNMRNSIIELGGEFYFNTCVNDIVIKDGRLCEVRTADKVFEADVCVAAIGHSARDTMHMLYEKNICMEPKAFAVGVRIQHEQDFINEAQYGKEAPKSMPAAAYKLTARLENGRGVYTFCMCPGGYVVNASSEKERLAVNGMSYAERASGYANSAVITTINPKDYIHYADNGIPKALTAIAFQRDLEEKAYAAAGGKIPVQSFGDFKSAEISNESKMQPMVKGEWAYADVNAIFPKDISRSIADGIEKMAKKIPGFDDPEALVMGVESRTSSPVRIKRDETFQCNIPGVYPCGEGAGYAGGITSAAVDGIKTAEAIASVYKSLVNA